ISRPRSSINGAVTKPGAPNPATSKSMPRSRWWRPSVSCSGSWKGSEPPLGRSVLPRVNFNAGHGRHLPASSAEAKKEAMKDPSFPPASSRVKAAVLFGVGLLAGAVLGFLFGAGRFSRDGEAVQQSPDKSAITFAGTAATKGPASDPLG